jgi:hypothetical protein
MKANHVFLSSRVRPFWERRGAIMGLLTWEFDQDTFWVGQIGWVSCKYCRVLKAAAPAELIRSRTKQLQMLIIFNYLFLCFLK